jgi:hypothetical protein
LADVALFKGKAGLGLKVRDVAEVAGGEIIYAQDGVAFAQKPISEVRTEKAGSAGHKYAHSQRFLLRGKGPSISFSILTTHAEKR